MPGGGGHPRGVGIEGLEAPEGQEASKGHSQQYAVVPQERLGELPAGGEEKAPWDYRVLEMIRLQEKRRRPGTLRNAHRAPGVPEDDEAAGLSRQPEVGPRRAGA